MVPRPAVRLLVCACSLKPALVQENCKLVPPPVVMKFSVGGAGGVADNTVIAPSIARLLLQVTPAPPPVTVIAAPPDRGWLNSVNLSPATREGPRFDTVSVPVPVF